MLIISNGKSIELNDEQVSALNELSKFLRSKDLFICVSGRAGTGKTTIIKQAIKGHYGVVVTAPTHQAKKVVANATGLEAETIHSLLSLRPDMDLEKFDKNNVLFSFQGEDKISLYRIVVIDEAFMINRDLIEMIKSKAKDYNIKVIFMGDAMQLPPVKEDESSLLSDKEIILINLTKVERQSQDNPLLLLHDKILSNINSSKDIFEKVNNMNEDKGYSFSKSTKEFGENAYEIIKDDLLNQRILCFTNDSVRRWNNYMRVKYVGDYNLPLQKDEILTGYRSVRNKNELRMLDIQNSSQYQVSSIIEDKVNDFKVFKTVLKDVDTGVSSRVLIINNQDEQTVYNFTKKESELHGMALNATQNRGMYWKMYYNFKDKFLLLGDIRDSSGNISCKKELDFSYAITIHKSQGSTYKNVFTDKDIDILQDNNSLRNRLKYVAYSRPTHAAYING